MTQASRQAPASLVDIFVDHLGDAPRKRAYTFLDDRGREAAVLTFEELFRRASAVASELGSRGYEGERAVLLFPPGLQFVAAFVGCLMAGVAAVPAYPPRSTRNERLHAILRNAEPVAVLTESRTGG